MKPGIPEAEEAQGDDDEEEDEVDDDDVEEEKFDIDDSSAVDSNKPSSIDLVAMAKAEEENEAREAALAISMGNPAFRDRARSKDGIETPDRFAGEHPHPPRVSPRHVSFDYGTEAPSANGGGGNAMAKQAVLRSMSSKGQSSSSSSSSSSQSAKPEDHANQTGEKGDRDHIHSPQLLSSGRSRIPRDRDVEAESMLRTPTRTETQDRTNARGNSPGPKRGHHRAASREHDSCIRRAFAVWGQDESDSNASDSDGR